MRTPKEGAVSAPVLLLLLLLSTAAPRGALAFDLSEAVVYVSFTGAPPRSSRLLTGNLFDAAYAGTLVPEAWISTPGSQATFAPSGFDTLTFSTAQITAPTTSFINLSLDTLGTLSLSAKGLDSVLSPSPIGFLTLTSSRFAGLDFNVVGTAPGVSSVSIDPSGIINLTVLKSIDTNAGAYFFQLTDPICFPASSTLRRLTAGGAAQEDEEAWETVAMPELRVGDTVECLAREPVFGRNNATSAAYGRLGRCTVYGYKKALPATADTAAPYTRITYEGAGNDVGAVTMSANHHLLDPLTGQARQAGSLRPGDGVLRATPSGALVPARVRSVASVREGGAYVPLLSGGGLPIVDGVVAYPSSGESDVGLDAKHWGQHYLHAPLWQALLPEAAPPAGAKREASPPGAGRTLAELGAQAPVAAFTQRWHAVRAAAAREGRATCDWAGVAAEMHAAIAGQGKRYTEAEALAVLDRHHKAAAPRGVAEA